MQLRKRHLDACVLAASLSCGSAGAAAGVTATVATMATLATVAMSGCSGAQYQGNVYRGDGIAFRTGGVPASWQKIDVSGATLAFRNDGAEATLLINARCGKDADDVPLSALTQHLFMRFTERQLTSQKLVPMDGREALHTVMKAKLDGVAKAFDVFVLKKDGCVYDFVDIAAPESFEATRGPFEAFVAGFHALDG